MSGSLSVHPQLCLCVFALTMFNRKQYVILERPPSCYNADGIGEYAVVLSYQD